MHMTVITKAIFTNYRDRIVLVKETEIMNIMKSSKDLKKFLRI